MCTFGVTESREDKINILHILCQHDPGNRSHAVGRKTGNEGFESDNLSQEGLETKSTTKLCC